jgi:hypothetical protein
VQDGARTLAVEVPDLMEDETFATVEGPAEAPAVPGDLVVVEGEAGTVGLECEQRFEFGTA